MEFIFDMRDAVEDGERLPHVFTEQHLKAQDEETKLFFKGSIKIWLNISGDINVNAKSLYFTYVQVKVTKLYDINGNLDNSCE